MTERCPYCNDAGFVCGNHPTRPWDHDGCRSAGTPCCRCEVGKRVKATLDFHRTERERTRPLWKMEKGRNEFLANAVTIPGAGTCLQFQMNDASGPSQIYRDDEEFAKTANDKREELIARGWGDVPKLAPEN